jgi:hypothetical protein
MTFAKEPSLFIMKLDPAICARGRKKLSFLESFIKISINIFWDCASEFY